MFPSLTLYVSPSLRPLSPSTSYVSSTTLSLYRLQVEFLLGRAGDGEGGGCEEERNHGGEAEIGKGPRRR